MGLAFPPRLFYFRIVADDEDLPEFDDLMGVDLSQLDLDDIELDPKDGSGLFASSGARAVWRWVGGVVVLGLGGLVLWLPSTEIYQYSAHSSWLFAIVCIVATVVGVLFGRWLWLWAEDAAQRWIATRPRRDPDAPPKPPSTLRRVMTLLVALAGAGVILFAITPADLSGGQSGYSSIWFLAAVGAIVIGFLLGRWLLMQEYNPFKGAAKPVQIRLPPWLKWVTLTIILGGGVLVFVGMEVFATEDRESLEFSLGGAAFVIGIVAAVWVARRFDETERKIRKRVEEERRRI